MQVSLKQIIDIVKDSVTVAFSEEIQSVYFEKFKATQKDKSFPRLSFFFSDNITLGQNSNQVSLNFEFLDLLSGRKNENKLREELVSDLINLASRFVTYLEKEKRVNLERPITVTPTDKVSNDGLTSIELDITFNLKKPCL